MNMLARYGKAVLLPGRPDGTATEDVRALLALHGAEAVDATPEFAERYPGIQRPALIVAGKVYEGAPEIARALIYLLRF